jgi:hypothetical protein
MGGDDVKVTSFFFQSGSVGRSFNRAVSQGKAVLRAWAVFRDSAKLPGRGFTETAWGGKWRRTRGQTQWAPSSTVVALSFLTGDLTFSYGRLTGVLVSREATSLFHSVVFTSR